MKTPPLVAALDLGDSSFTLAVGRLNEQNQLFIQALATIPAQGMEKGVFSDPIECSDAVARLARQVEKALSIRLPKLAAVVHGSHLKTYNASAAIPIPDPTVGISKKDVQRVITTCRTLSLDYDRQILHAFERGYIVDGQAGIKDPVGLSGNKLSVDLHLVTAQNLSVQNLIKVLNRAGLEVGLLVLPGVAAAEAVLPDLDRDLGVTLVRIGEFQTEILIFTDGAVRETLIIPWGTDHLAESFSKTFKLPTTSVDQILEQVKSIDPHPEWAEMPVRVQAGSLVRSFPQGEVAQLVGSKAREFLAKIRRQIDNSVSFRDSAAGILMVGELAHLDGFLEAAESILNVPVRLGTLREIQRDPGVEISLQHTTAIGLLRCAAKQAAAQMHAPAASFWERSFEKARLIFEEYF